jgi:hypothetical protein
MKFSFFLLFLFTYYTTQIENNYLIIFKNYELHEIHEKNIQETLSKIIFVKIRKTKRIQDYKKRKLIFKKNRQNRFCFDSCTLHLKKD